MNKLNYNATAEEAQAYLANVERKILAKLPVTLEQTAKATGAIVRKREIKSATDLILVLFVYAMTNISQRLLAAFVGILGIANISDQAWQKKRLNANAG